MPNLAQVETAMALEGNLEEFNIVAVLQMIASGGMTGTLSVRDTSNKAIISFTEGYIVHAESTLQEDRLGEILIRTRRLSQGQLDKAAQHQLRQESGKRLGQILVELRAITRDDLVMAVQIQILEVMSQLLLWSRGLWRFEFGLPDPNNITPAEAMSVDEILSGQILLLDTVDPVYDRSAVLNAVYDLMPGRSLDSARITLERDQWRVLSAIDGRGPLRDVAHRVGLDPDHVAHIVSELVAVELLHQVGTAEAESESYLLTGTSDSPLPPPSPTNEITGPLTTVVNLATLDKINDLLRALLTRTEAHEACLIDSTGSLITRQGREVHRNYPSLFALAASIFASWQELGRTLGESRASTLLYQGQRLNICLAPVASQAILMTLYQSASDSGLVNFWSREATGRLLRLLDEGKGPPSSNSSHASDLPTDYQIDAERAMDNLLTLP
jgi:predicted regulator of Ras-like GTPase activity (Roadblock/LC7/MglB family)